MEFFPPLGWGILNGWLLVALFYLVYIILLRVFPKDVVQRLYDRSNWTKPQRTLSAIGFPFALTGLLLVIFTPLKIGLPVFYVGLPVYSIGFTGFVIALFNFKNTPMDQPVTTGLYKVSRNPQWVMFALMLIGASLTVGSGIAILMFTVRIVFNHFRILGEERTCIQQYGDSYRNYLEGTPRYLLLF